MPPAGVESATRVRAPPRIEPAGPMPSLRIHTGQGTGSTPQPVDSLVPPSDWLGAITGRRSLLLHWLLSAKSPPPLPLGSSSAACDPHSSFLAPQSRMSTRAARGLAGGVLLPRAPCFLGTDRGLEGRGSRTDFNFGALGTPTTYRPGRRHLAEITSPEGAGPFLSTHLALCLTCCCFIRSRPPLKGARAV